MGGVDFMDRLISHYPHGFKNKKMVPSDIFSVFEYCDCELMDFI